MKKAQFYLEKEQGLQCTLCPHFCVIASGNHGLCRVRKHIDGVLTAASYGLVSGLQVDPIEKKPLFHFMPGTKTLSFGSYGCNFRCGHCQNWHLSMETPYVKPYTPDELIALAQQLQTPSISFTYNEPVISYEFMLDTAKVAKTNDLAVVMVTNGYINPVPLQQLLPFVDALNIDLKAFHTQTYQDMCGGKLEPVLKTIETAAASCHVEITTLLVTDVHQKQELVDMFHWLAGISPDIPLHLTRYFPAYQNHARATAIRWVNDMCAEAAQVLNYVYPGNC